jgi:uncharacterized membrane protein
MVAFSELLGVIGYVIEAVGVIAIVIGFFLSAVWFVGQLRSDGGLSAFQRFRENLARSIILGLEFLIAGDIVRTVTVEQTINSAAVLALIVLIRIVLSLLLEIEIRGRWPWQRHKDSS